MSEVPDDRVSLRKAVEYDGALGVAITDLIESEHRSGFVPIFGWESPQSLVRVPRYYEIDWIGPPGGTDYRPRAIWTHDSDWPGPITQADRDREFCDLEIARQDWARIRDQAMASLGLTPAATSERYEQPEPHQRVSRNAVPYLDLDQALESLCNELEQSNGLTSLEDISASWFSTRERVVERIRRMWLASDAPIVIRGRPWNLELDEAIGDPVEIPPHTDMRFHYSGDVGDLVRIYRWEKRGSQRKRVPAEVWGELAINEGDFARLKAILTSRRRGPRATVRQSIADRMFVALREDRLTAEGLQKMKLASLVAEYGGSINTANGARGDALDRFSEFQKNNSE